MGFKKKAKQRAYQAEWMARRRQRWIDANGPCKRCGATEDLEIDHIDPAKKTNHRVWSWKRERRERELRKCQVLCSDCHKHKTWIEQRGENNHNAKLTRSDVWAILEGHRKGETQTALARRYGTSQKNVWRIVRGKRWAHVYEAFHREAVA